MEVTDVQEGFVHVEFDVDVAMLVGVALRGASFNSEFEPHGVLLRTIGSALEAGAMAAYGPVKMLAEPTPYQRHTLTTLRAELMPSAGKPL